MSQDRHYECVRYNELAGCAEVHLSKNGEPVIRRWTDADEAESMRYIEDEYGLYSREKHTAALRLLFDERKYNPIVDLVDSFAWDGTPRCQHFLTKWAKCEDNEYTREVSRLIFAGGIHRLYAPGTKFDDVPILMGDQGCGKSSIVRFLALNDNYYGEVTAVEGQPAIEQLQGKWICEISELLALTRNKDQEAVKAYITRAIDSYRKPWDKNVTEFPRRCIFIGSTNDVNGFLVDKTGNRRFYPVEVHSNGYEIFSHEDEIRDYIEQCWAEAKVLFDKRQMPNYADRRYIALYREAQENAMQDDWRVGAIQAFLDRKLPGELTCVREVCHRALSPNPDFPKEPSLAESKDIGRILNKLKDWERVNGSRTVGNYGKQRVWRKRGEAAQKPDKPFWED